MSKLSVTQKEDALSNFLRTLSKNEKLFIQKSDRRNGQRFAIAERTQHGSINVRTEFMNYSEMNCFFMGILSAKENRINL